MNPVSKGHPGGVRDIWLSVVIYFSVEVFCAFLLLPITIRMFPWLSSFLASLLLARLPLMILLIYFSSRHGKIGAADLVPQGKDFLVLSISVIVLFVAAAQMVFLGGARSEINQAISNLQGLQHFLAVCIVVFVSPFLEETVFRKYILEILLRKYTSVVAIMIVVCLETLIHLGLKVSGLILIFVYSVFFTLVYLKSRLGVSILIHCLTNVFVLLVAWH